MDKENINNQLEEKITEIIEEGIQVDNINMLGKLVDIHKDLANEEYWCKKEEVMSMRYRGDYDRYENYGRGNYGARQRDSRGRYMGRGNYRGEEMIDEMMENYGTYMEGRNYGGPETDKAFDYMLKAAEDFMMHLFEESDSPEKEEKIRRTARKISEMRM